ncbi:hypothetical protein NIES2100_55400 [Calothrix sp. NIES-2100]|uniref:FecR family protein n=1 Tax=Calothrix sp. NIES-2100 TaxID=1954172 RepID=UPI000B5DFEC0|nr:hypothetical protein NIES2100_55400 [Calothrix sp. NIES-2100]
MFKKLFPLLAIGIWGVVVLPLSRPANATIPLTQAQIQDLRNLVQLIPKNTKKRPARKLDPMKPGDGLSTGRASLADLRFNDGSLARVGEQAVFQFLPKTRNFSLSNGTVLLLIPPGQGQTRINTPNAAAAIRGSGLFVRYDKQTDTTIVGALTNSGIEVSNKKGSQSRVLEAGQLIVIVKDKFQGLYEFDLRHFYETSDLVRGLDLTRQNLAPTPDPAIASVQAETAAAIATQTPLKGEGVLENPSFLQLTATSSDSPSNDNSNNSNQEDASLDPSQDDSSVDSFVDTGEVQLSGQPGNNSNNNNVDTSQSLTKPQIPVQPSVTPPTTDGGPSQPPVVTPPTTDGGPSQPPVVTPPTTDGGPSQPPVVTPPTKDGEPSQPPVVTPPTTDGGPSQPPVVTPPTTDGGPSQPPVVTPPTTDGGPSQPPVVTPPTTDGGPSQPPVVTPPTTDGGPSQPPVVTPPTTDGGPSQPPVVTPPTTDGGPSQPPVVTPPTTDGGPSQPPVVTPPTTDGGPSQPPVVTPPTTDGGPSQPPVVTPPTTDGGPSQPPVVTPPTTDGGPSQPPVVTPTEPPERPTS